MYLQGIDQRIHRKDMKLWLNERMKILKDDLHALSLQTHQNKMQKIEMKGRNGILKIELNC